MFSHCCCLGKSPGKEEEERRVLTSITVVRFLTVQTANSSGSTY